MYKYLLLVFLSVVVTVLGSRNYYWKDYTGIVPGDAVPGGHDINNEITYIGMVYIKEAGIFPATLHPKAKTVFVSADQVRKSENYIQILCTENRDNIRWIPANKTDLHFITMNKHLIRGGIQDQNWLHIGRINYQGELLVGKVLSGRAGIQDAVLNFIHNEKEKVGYSYEILTFDDNTDPKNDAEVLLDEREAMTVVN